MSPAELRLLDFVEDRLDSLTHRPALWGSPTSVEDQVLQLLELRRFLLDPRLSPRDTGKLMSAYTRFVAEVIGAGSTPEPLAVQLERHGRGDELSRQLQRFVEQELAMFIASAGQETPDLPSAPDIERTQRVIERLRRSVAILERHRPPSSRPIVFPEHRRP